MLQYKHARAGETWSFSYAPVSEGRRWYSLPGARRDALFFAGGGAVHGCRDTRIGGGMLNMLAAIAITAFSIVLGGFGLYRVAYAQGFVCGYDAAQHPEEVTFTGEDDD